MSSLSFFLFPRGPRPYFYSAFQRPFIYCHNTLFLLQKFTQYDLSPATFDQIHNQVLFIYKDPLVRAYTATICGFSPQYLFLCLVPTRRLASFGRSYLILCTILIQGVCNTYTLCMQYVHNTCTKCTIPRAYVHHHKESMHNTHTMCLEYLYIS